MEPGSNSESVLRTGELPASNQYATLPATQPRLLVADDERAIAMIVQRTLTRAGYEVDTVNDGKAAIEALRTKGYDVVISDISMPGANGLDVTEAAKELTPDTEVILITGDGSISTAVAGSRWRCASTSTRSSTGSRSPFRATVPSTGG